MTLVVDNWLCDGVERSAGRMGSRKATTIGNRDAARAQIEEGNEQNDHMMLDHSAF